MKNDLDGMIETFANNKVIATQADALLSKLISAKSPVISNWFKRRDLENKSEIEIAKIWRLYFAQNFILTQYPQDDAKTNTEIEKLVDLKSARNNAVPLDIIK